MNTKHFTKSLLFGASLLLASAAFAGERASVQVFEDVKINGTKLAAGRYQLAWEGTGSNVQVSFRQGNVTVATVPAVVETASEAASRTGYSARKDEDGSKQITSIFFAGKKVSINLNQQAVAASAQSAPASDDK